MSASDVGRDAYDVGDHFLRRMRGGLGLATVGSNAVFAAVTGVSIASAAIFTRVAVPEMLRLGLQPALRRRHGGGQFGAGHADPAQILLIIFAILTEQSIGMMFFAGIGPGILLSAVYCGGIIAWPIFTPSFVYDQTGRFADPAPRDVIDAQPGRDRRASRCRSCSSSRSCWAASMAGSSPRPRRARSARSPR